jgi:hypothetical protein
MLMAMSLFPDGDKVRLGAGADLVLQHDGSHSYIQNITGNLNLQGKAGENGIVLVPDGAVTLYHNNAAKLATASGGVTVTGVLTATTHLDTVAAFIRTSSVGQLYLRNLSGINRIDSYNDPISATYPLQINASQTTFFTSDAERMRIDASGNLLVGTTAQGASALITGRSGTNRATAFLDVNVASSTATPVMVLSKFDNNSTTSQIFVQFTINNGSGGSGQIQANGANTAAFGTYSDSRLKENIVDLPSQLANIMALRPVEYDYIESEGGGHQIGFVAQEVQKIYPDLIGEREDGMFTLADMNKNDARLIKCMQEQQTTIEALEARITALEG